MKTMKNLALGVALLTASAFALPTTHAVINVDLELYTSPAVITAKTGDTVAFDVMVKNPNHQLVTSAYVWMSYDPNALEGLSITSGSQWNNVRDMYFDHDLQLLKIGVYNGYRTDGENIKVATVKMKVRNTEVGETNIRFYQYPTRVNANVLDGQNIVNAAQTPPVGVTVKINQQPQPTKIATTEIKKPVSQAPAHIRFPSRQQHTVPNPKFASAPMPKRTINRRLPTRQRISFTENMDINQRTLRFKNSKFVPRDFNQQIITAEQTVDTVPQERDVLTRQIRYRTIANMNGQSHHQSGEPVPDSSSNYRTASEPNRANPTLATTLPKTGASSVFLLVLGVVGAAVAVRRQKLA